MKSLLISAVCLVVVFGTYLWLEVRGSHRDIKILENSFNFHKDVEQQIHEIETSLKTLNKSKEAETQR